MSTISTIALAAMLGQGLSQPVVGSFKERTLSDYIRQLESAEPDTRKFAAREVRRAARAAARLSDRDSDATAVLEARHTMTLLHETAGPTCAEQLVVDNITALCADILGEIGFTEGLDELGARAAGEERKRVKKRIEKAITAIEEEAE